jgi:hypothetical protein
MGDRIAYKFRVIEVSIRTPVVYLRGLRFESRPKYWLS